MSWGLPQRFAGAAVARRKTHKFNFGVGVYAEGPLSVLQRPQTLFPRAATVAIADDDPYLFHCISLFLLHQAEKVSFVPLMFRMN